MKTKIIILSSLLFLGQGAFSQEEKHQDHDHSSCHNHSFNKAPIGVMGDHMHHKGSLMVSYRFMNMGMDGSLSGTNSIENSDVFAMHMVSPQTMTMNGHMLGAMYAPTDNFTLMVMGKYYDNSMDLQTKMGMGFTTESGGFGDISVSGLVKLLNKENTSVHGSIGLSIPTGDFDQRDNTPMMQDAQLAYPMQLGSGTWDPSLGLTYLGASNMLSWGVQANYKHRLGDNSENYTLGNIFTATSWASIKTVDNLFFSVRAKYFNSGAIDGADADLNPMMMPLFNTANSGKSELDLLGGLNYSFSKGALNGLNIGAEVGYPVYQDVTGIQMKQQLTAIVGVQYLLIK